MIPTKEQLDEAIDKIKLLTMDLEEPFKTAAATLLLKAALENHSTVEPTITTAISDNKPMSASELLRIVNPKSFTEAVLMAGYYLEITVRMKSFNVKDVVQVLKDARNPLPQNPSDIINRCAVLGWIMKIGEKGNMTSWALTRTGQELVKKKLSEAEKESEKR